MPKRWGRIADLGEKGLPDNWPTINRWISKEGFPAPSRPTRGCTLFDLDEVDAWLQARKAKPAPTEAA